MKPRRASILFIHPLKLLSCLSTGTNKRAGGRGDSLVITRSREVALYAIERMNTQGQRVPCLSRDY